MTPRATVIAIALMTIADLVVKDSDMTDDFRNGTELSVVFAIQPRGDLQSFFP